VNSWNLSAGDRSTAGSALTMAAEGPLEGVLAVAGVDDDVVGSAQAFNA
jgi:hypothetical protein